MEEKYILISEDTDDALVFNSFEEAENYIYNESGVDAQEKIKIYLYKAKPMFAYWWQNHKEKVK